MGEHLSQEQIDGYRRRSLTARELLVVDDHIAECESCRGRIAEAIDVAERIKSPETWLNDDDDASHLDYDRLASYVDGTLSPEARKSAEAHLRDCPICRDAVGDLESDKRAIAGEAIRFRTQQTRKRLTAFAAAAIAVIGAVLIFSTIVRHDHRQIASTSSFENMIRTRMATSIANGKLDLSTPEVGSLLAAHSDVLGAAPSDFKAFGPSGTAMRENQPIFRWTTVKNITGYVVTITEGSAVIASNRLTGLSWQPGENLPEGVVLAWQVRAMRDGAAIDAAPEPPAHFLVLTATRRDEVAAGERLFRNDPLALGAFYAEYALIGDATNALGKAPASPEATHLLDQVRSLHRRIQ